MRQVLIWRGQIMVENVPAPLVYLMNTSFMRIFRAWLTRYIAEKPSLMTDLNVRLANGVFWSLAGSIALQGLTLLAAIPIARLLGKEGFGELGIIQSTIMTFAFFSGPSLGQTTTKYIAELHFKDAERVGRIIGLTYVVGVAVSALLALLLYVAAPFLATRALNAPSLSSSLEVAALVLFLTGINGAQLGILSGYEAFRSIAMINFLRGLVTPPIMVLGAYFGGVKGVVIALAAIMLITLLKTHRTVKSLVQKHSVTIRYRSAAQEWRILPAFYIPTVLSGIVSWPATWIANAFLVNQPNGYAEMGIFNAANQWRMAVQFLPTIVGQPTLPILSNLYGKNASRDFHRMLRVNLLLAVAVALIPALFIAAASRFIMQAYGGGFSQGASVLIVLVLTTVLSTPSAVIGTAISSVGKRWQAAGLNFIWAASFLGASLALVHYGAIGLAVAYLLSYLIHLLVVGVYALFVLRPMLGMEDPL